MEREKNMFINSQSINPGQTLSASSRPHQDLLKLELLKLVPGYKSILTIVPVETVTCLCLKATNLCLTKNVKLQTKFIIYQLFSAGV